MVAQTHWPWCFRSIRVPESTRSHRSWHVNFELWHISALQSNNIVLLDLLDCQQVAEKPLAVLFHISKCPTTNSISVNRTDTSWMISKCNVILGADSSLPNLLSGTSSALGHKIWEMLVFIVQKGSRFVATRILTEGGLSGGTHGLFPRFLQILNRIGSSMRCLSLIQNGVLEV